MIRKDEDCGAGTCDSGYCRGIDIKQCTEGHVCAAPLPGTPGVGNTCRAEHPIGAKKSGPARPLVVLADGMGGKTTLECIYTNNDDLAAPIALGEHLTPHLQWLPACCDPKQLRVGDERGLVRLSTSALPNERVIVFESQRERGRRRPRS